MASKSHYRSLANLLGPFIGLLVVVGLFSLSPEVRGTMFLGGNLKTILNQTVIVALGALGMTLIIISGGIDLSAGSLVALTSVCGACLIVMGMPVIVVVLGTILAGGLAGAVNGGIIGRFQMVPFIVTLGMMGVARGASKWLSDNQTVNYDGNHPVNSIMRSRNPLEFFPLPAGVWVTLVLAIIMGFVLRKSIFGRYIFAIGSNEDTARLCGVRVRWTKFLVYTVAGLFFGLAGLMQLSRLTQGDPSIAVGLELEIIAAVVIGGASLNGGSGSILGSMIGALIMAILKNGSSQLLWPDYMQEIIIGIVIIIAVAIDKFRQRRPA
ncbi:MAG: ABC transporter permease [Verrucomicrobiota bacterium]